MRSISRSMFVWIPVILAVAAVAGCSQSGPPMAQVSGTVTLDGSPVEGAVVALEPVAGGRPATATTDASGNFSTEALLGETRIGVTKTKTAAVEADPDSPEGEQLSGDMSNTDIEYLLPVKYAAPRESGLTADVQPGMAPLNLELKTAE